MQAALIAAIADIHLQGVETAAAQRGKGNGFEQRQRVTHCGILRLRRQCATLAPGLQDKSA